MSYPHTRLFIAGTWQDAADGKTIAVHNPATGKEIGRVAHAAKADGRRGGTWRGAIQEGQLPKQIENAVQPTPP